MPLFRTTPSPAPPPRPGELVPEPGGRTQPARAARAARAAPRNNNSDDDNDDTSDKNAGNTTILLLIIVMIIIIMITLSAGRASCADGAALGLFEAMLKHYETIM